MPLSSGYHKNFLQTAVIVHVWVLSSNVHIT